MKKSHLWLCAVVFFVVSFFAFGEELVPLVGPAEFNFLDWIKGILSLKDTASTMNFVGVASAVLKLLVDLTKWPALGGVFDKLGALGKLLLINGLATLLVLTTALASGANFFDALGATLASSAGAVFLTEMLKLVKKAVGISGATA